MESFTKQQSAAYWGSVHALAAELARDDDEELLAAVCQPGAPLWINRASASAQTAAFHRALEHCGGLRGARVLEIGCGTGRWSRLLRDRGADVCAVDFSAGAIERDRARLPGIDFRCGDFLELDFQPESFDIAVSVTVLQHLPPDDQPAAIGRLGALLRPGGRVLVLENTRDRGAHVFGRSRREWIALFEASGFRPVYVREYGFDLPLRGLSTLKSFARRGNGSHISPEELAAGAFHARRSRLYYELVYRLPVLTSQLSEHLGGRLIPGRLAGHCSFVFERARVTCEC